MVSAGGERQPEQDMHPEGRREAQLDPDGEADDDAADDEDQEGGRPVADVEAGEIEPAGAAFRLRSWPAR